MSIFTDEQLHKLSGPMHPAYVSEHPYTKNDYIQGWQVEAMLNSIFGHDGWETEVQTLERVYLDKTGKNSKWQCAYTCVASVTVTTEYGSRRTHTGVGSGSGDAANVTDAIDSACKEAATDAMKRAAKRFGWPLGLACYDKNKRHYGKPTPFVPTADDAPEVKINPAANKPKETVPGSDVPPGVTDEQLCDEFEAILDMEIRHTEMIAMLGKALAGWGGREALNDAQRGAINGFCYGLPELNGDRRPSTVFAKNKAKLAAWNLAREFSPRLQEWEASIGGES